MDRLDKLKILKSANELRTELITDLGLEFPFDLENVLEILGINYSDIPLDEDLDGKIKIDSDEIRIFTNSEILYESRKRFTIGHELGHWKIHFCDNPYQTIKCKAKDLGFFNEKKSPLEYEADLFASEFLLPTDIFIKETGRLLPSMKSLESLSEKYKTSLTATAIKFIELTQEPCALVLMSNKNIKWKIPSRSFPHTIKDNITDCYCFDMLEEGKNSIRDSLYVSNWTYTKSLQYIYEDVRNFSNLNQQLIILSLYDESYYKSNW